MEYFINPAAFSAVFTVPASVADSYLKLASGEHIKVLIYIMRYMSDEPSVKDISEATDVSEYDVKEALLYWADAGILLPKKGKPLLSEEVKPKAVNQITKPSRTDVARRGMEDSKIKYLLQETQMKLGRNLKTNESSILVWLYDDQGLDVSIILLIVQYAVTHNRANIRFIESTAVDWINKGIDSISDADEELRKMAMGDQSWNIVQSAFGLEKRKPSKKEMELSLKWIDEWKISKEMLTGAYDACVNSKSKFSFAYVAKILESWHEKGYNKPEDAEKNPKPADNGSYAAYDLDLFEKMLNSKD